MMTSLAALSSLVLCLVIQPANEPTSARERYQRAAAALRASNSAQAITELEAMLRDHAEHSLAPAAAVTLGNLYLKLNQPDQAAKLLTEWQQRIDTAASENRIPAGTASQAHLQLAVALEQQGQADEAAAQWQLVAEDLGAGERRAAASLKLTPYYLARQEAKKAHELAASCAACGLSSSKHAEFRLKQAELFISGGAPQYALEQLSGLDASKLEPQQAFQARWLRSEAHLTLRQPAVAAREQDELLTQLRENLSATQPDKRLVGVAIRRCETAFLLKDTSRVKSLAGEIIALHPDDELVGELEVLLGRALVYDIDFEEARAHFARAAKLAAEKRPDTAARAHWWIGETYFLSRDYTAASAAYAQVIENYRKSEWAGAALVQRGKCRELMQEPAAAVEDYRRVVSEYAQTTWKQQADARLTELNATNIATGPNANGPEAKRNR